MAQHLTQQSPDQDNIDLREIIFTIIESKKLIILTILIFTIAASIYSLSLKPEFKSSTILEIGYFEMSDGTQELIEKPSDLISNLKIYQLLNSESESKDISFKVIENRYIRLETSSNSATDNEKLLNSFNDFIMNRHNEFFFISSNLSQSALLDKIDSIDTTMSFIKAKQSQENQLERLVIKDKIEKFTAELPLINLGISQLEKIINDDSNNLKNIINTEYYLERASNSPTLEQIIFSYKSKLNDLNAKKNFNILETKSLNNQLKNLENLTLQSDELFSLEQEQKILKSQLQKLINQTTVKTYPIEDIRTITIKPKILITILLGLIIGFISSIFLVFIRDFIKSYKESQS